MLIATPEYRMKNVTIDTNAMANGHASKDGGTT